jgi:DNA invertase Pin-like site-specific DNA recombinase
MKTTCYSYIRFSSPQQAAGDSLRRQTEAAADWCKRNNATLDTSTTFRDLGTSAFKGNHRGEGNALGTFLRLVEQGKIAKGSVLLIENLDRLSRENPWDAVPLLCSIVNAGVTVATLSPSEMVYQRGRDLTPLILAVVEFGRGNNESEIKSSRCTAAWAEKKRQARAGKHVLSHNMPAWIEERNGQGPRKLEGATLHLIPERAAIVQRIYQLAAGGYGLCSIVKLFNQEKVPTMGKSGRWVRSYVAQILLDRRAIGEFQPHAGRNHPDGYKPDGEPIAAYYPAAVTEAEWYAARGAMLSRRNRRGRTGTYVNLFAGLLHDARDGSTYFRQVAGRQGSHALLMNSASREDKKVPCRTFPLDTFEKAVLSLLREIDPSEVLGRDTATDEVRSLTTQLHHIRLHRDALENELLNGDVAALARALRRVETQEQELAAKLADAQQRAAHPLSEAWGEVASLSSVLEGHPDNLREERATQSLLDLVERAPNPQDVRLRLREALRRIVEDIRLLIMPRGHDRLCAVQMWFAGGERHRDYLIVHRAAKSHGTPSAWFARSLASITAPGALDLRKKAHMKDLERVLLEMDLAEIINRA